MDDELYAVETARLKEKIRNWRHSYIEHINNYIAGRSINDPAVVATFISGQKDDTQVLIQWCEILAHKVEQLEAKLNNQ